MPGALVVCGTPIGNLDDASPRLARTLGGADLVACEDTRHTRRLLGHLGVRARVVSYHEFNERRRTAELVERIAAGARVALVSDAGMPGVSDPGYQLVQACIAQGLPVEAVPGPSAILTALVLSGLPADRFCFEGFLSRKPGVRRRRLDQLAGEPRTLVFFEAPHRVAETLVAMAGAFGPGRRCALARELTKLHEEVVRGTLGELAERAAAEPPRGELTLVVAGAPAADPARTPDLAAEVAARVESGMDRKQAMSEVARASGAPRRVVYQAVLDARADRPPGGPAG
ncbi:MAG TPA: 16S rRNA (cytidine(1402)-2'-O)-methyltransferase [Actinomycetes bacterium]|nr:16S rRNA (cytidine(1402)-2'-O)-methyltransferase [Actinomycetes bacterium]